MMKCNDVRTFMSEVANKSPLAPNLPVDLNYLSTNGYVSVMQKGDYDKTVADVANLGQMSADLQNETVQERIAADALNRDYRKTHSILFHFEGKDKKQAEIQAVESERATVVAEEADITAKDAKIAELIQKKSMIDRMVALDGQYVSLTGLGVMTLNDLNVRNYRVSDTDFSQYIAESQETSSELKDIAGKSGSYENGLRTGFPKADTTQLWSVAIGLAKLQGDQNQIGARFLAALGVIQHFGSTIDNKLMAAEIMTAVTLRQSAADNSDLQALSKSLSSLEHDVRHHAKVPKQLSAGVAAMMLFGRRFDGTYPMDRLIEFTKMTRSPESAAILAVVTTPIDQLAPKFQSYKSLFSSWGYVTSEDTELASAFLSISDFAPGDIMPKMTIIVSGLRTYLEYPLVAAAILTSIASLEANETLDLLEKAYSILGSVAVGLQRSELLSLAVRMIHGINNELVRKLDPTAKIMNTPIQFTYIPAFIFFPYHAPLIIAHSTYYSTFSAIGGTHPAHVHGFGGGFGG
jgi:hypothetical protein